MNNTKNTSLIKFQGVSGQVLHMSDRDIICITMTDDKLEQFINTLYEQYTSVKPFTQQPLFPDDNEHYSEIVCVK